MTPGSAFLNPLLFAEGTPTATACRWTTCCCSPLFWALTAGGLWLLVMMPRGLKKGRLRNFVGTVFGASTLALLGLSLPAFHNVSTQVVFYIFAVVTIASAAAAISMKSAVYSAIWFAMSLLGTGGLLFVQGAQFLGVATIVVYAGAIVVTFLFIVMLAQPEGHDVYDRVSWGWLAKPLSVFGATVMVAALSVALASVRESSAATSQSTAATSQAPGTSTSAQPNNGQSEAPKNDVLNQAHMARLGAQLFSRYLMSVEVAGTLLMIALIGAVAIVIHGKDQIIESEGSSHE